MVVIDKNLLPVKAHYFFLMSAMGPILPYLPVFGKMLGISEIVIGTINATLPIVNLIIKPIFGFLLDYFNKSRKIIFMSTLFFTSAVFLSMTFIPQRMESRGLVECQKLNSCNINETLGEEQFCTWKCPQESFEINVLNYDNKTCILNGFFKCKNYTELCELKCQIKESTYISLPFWFFVICVALGNAGFAVSNCLSDVICFDVLGPGKEDLYGKQRVWGSIGFGSVAFIGALLHFYFSNKKYSSYDYMPAFLLATFCMIIDLLCCTKLKLPALPTSSGIIRDTLQVLKKPQVAIFIIFATFVGICDSCIMFFLLWHLEDLAKATGHFEGIVLLEGIVIAVETLCGEVVCFFLAGKMIKKFGHRNCITLGFAIYVLRFFLLAIMPNPWYSVPIELFLQGPTYALLYNTVVSYASVVAPPGTSATVQGLVGGMDDGLGFAIGNLLGGIILKIYGGKILFFIAAAFALFSCILHAILNIKIQNYIDKEKQIELISSSEKGKINSVQIVSMLPKKGSSENVGESYDETQDPLVEKNNTNVDQ